MTQAARGGDRLALAIENFEKHYAEKAAGGIGPLSDFDRIRYTATAATTVYLREFFYHLLGRPWRVRTRSRSPVATATTRASAPTTASTSTPTLPAPSRSRWYAAAPRSTA